MASTTTRIKRFEKRVQEEVEKRKRMYAKRLEHARLKDEAMQARATETEEQRKERQVATSTYYSVLFINDIVSSVIVDFVSEAKKDAEIYRFETKKDINQLEDARQKYEDTLQSVVKYYGYYMYDMLDFISDKLKNDIFLYRNSIQMLFMRYKLPKYELLAQLETARSLAWYACQLCDTRIKAISKYDKLAFNFGGTRITTILNKLTYLADTLYKRYCPAGVKIELYKDINASNGIQIIANKIENGEVISAAIEFADSNVTEKQEDEL
jgi:hypothetical protein